MKMKGRITSLQRMSIHDGPGIRTVVFLKGCNMRCKWCHNPETWSFKPQIQYIQEKCIHCGTCIAACPQKAITPLADQIQIDYSLCANCGTCAASCCTQALSVVGEVVDIETLWQRIEKDLPFFKSSGGGITISGGEPLLQKEFVKEFLKHCKEQHIHTAIETNLSVNWEVIEELIPWVDLWMCDFKLFDSEKHKHWTGINNQATIQNICRLGEKKIPTLVRTPIIPGVNDSEEEIENICRILKPYADTLSYELLGFHTLGFPKYDSLGMENELKDSEQLSAEQLKTLKNILSKHQL